MFKRQTKKVLKFFQKSLHISLECRTFATSKEKQSLIIIKSKFYMKNLEAIFTDAKNANFAPDINTMSLENFTIARKEYQTKETFYSFVLGLNFESGTIEERFKYEMRTIRKSILSKTNNSTCAVTNALRSIERNTMIELYNQYERLLIEVTGEVA